MSETSVHGAQQHRQHQQQRQRAPQVRKQRQHHQRRAQWYCLQRQALREAEQAAAAAAYLADTLGLQARHMPSARTAKMATDALQIAIAAHALAAEIFADVEGEAAA